MMLIFLAEIELISGIGVELGHFLYKVRFRKERVQLHLTDLGKKTFFIVSEAEMNPKI